jgi:hypothetical protein
MFGIACSDFNFEESWESFQHTQMATAALSSNAEGIVAARMWSMGCKGWPVKSKNTHPKDYVIPKTSAPVLIMHALWDDATPYEWAVSVNRKIMGSVLLTRDGEGHGSLGFHKSSRVMLDYLKDPVKNLPEHLSVIHESMAGNTTGGYDTRKLGVKDL